MNDKIRELAEQAGFIIKPIYKSADDYRTPYFKDDKVEKFAELIINECGRVMEEKDSFYGEWMKTVINEHFGVK